MVKQKCHKLKGIESAFLLILAICCVTVERQYSSNNQFVLSDSFDQCYMHKSQHKTSYTETPYYKKVVAFHQIFIEASQPPI